MNAPELHLFAIWPKGRFAEKRILDDLGRQTERIWTGELRFPGDMASAYRRFYGPPLPDERRKLKTCGAGPFTVAVVRDLSPKYGIARGNGRIPLECNLHMDALKAKYRKWAGNGHRVHCTVTPWEFARDAAILTNHTAEEWERGVPHGAIAPRLPDGWLAVSSLEPFARGRLAPVMSAPGEKPPGPLLEDGREFLRGKYLNDIFLEGSFRGIDAVEKHSSKAVWSIGNEYRIAVRMYEATPEVVARPLAWRYSADGREASVATERVRGPSLSTLLEAGLDESRADAFADDIMALADALERTGIVHRDLFGDNLLLAEDGHLKTIDWQMAIDRNLPREDPWTMRNWKFRHVVFGVNRDLPLGEWNDFAALEALLARFPQTAHVAAARASLAARSPAAAWRDPPGRAVRLKLRLYAVSLRLQMLLKGRKHRKYPQLERRLRTCLRP